MKFNTIRKDTLVLRLVEDEISNDRMVKVNDVWTEKNSFNEESDHSYYARVLFANSQNPIGVKVDDIVFLFKVYSRQIFKDDQNIPYMIVSTNSVMAKVMDFDVKQAFRLQNN